MAGSVRSLTSWNLAITLVSLTTVLWSGLIDAIVPEPYLVSLALKPSNDAHATRMRYFMLGKHRLTSVVNGTSGIPSLRRLLACGFIECCYGSLEN